MWYGVAEVGGPLLMLLPPPLLGAMMAMGVTRTPWRQRELWIWMQRQQ